MQNFTKVLNYTAYIFKHIQIELLDFYRKDIQIDWQLQGCMILSCLLFILIIFVKIEWNAYGSAIMRLELGKAPPLHHDDNIDGSFEFYPDEDPLTFLKKKQ